MLSQLLSAFSSPLTQAGAVLVTGFIVTRLVYAGRPVGQFLCQLLTLAGFTLMLVRAAVMPLEPTPAMGVTLTFVVISFFKMVWWLATAWLMAGFIRAVLVFKRQPVETRFLQDLFAGFIYVGALFGIIAYVFDIPVSGLLAASGVVAIVLGLALQSTLGDLFSGVVLNLAKPYRPGDWVILDGGLEGRVIETNWRATQILTLADDLAVVPNSVIAKARIVNASKPTLGHGLTVPIRLDPGVSPSAAVAMLETAMLSCNRILRMPQASVRVRSLDAVALECELAFFAPSFEEGPAAQNEVFDRVFRHCASAGIRLAPPAASALTLPTRSAPRDVEDLPKRLLERLPVFLPLSDEERLTLAPKIRRRAYKPGDIIVDEGVVAPALFILGTGVLAAFQKHGGTEAEMFRFAPGECFAQASMLTGAVTTFRVKALTRAVVYEIAKEDIAPILKARPAVAAELSQVMVMRQLSGKARLSELDEKQDGPGSLAERLTDRVKLAFGLK